MEQFEFEKLKKDLKKEIKEELKAENSISSEQLMQFVTQRLKKMGINFSH